MIRTLWIFPLIICGVAGLMTFNIMALGLGDTKFPQNIETALGFYFPIWLLFFTPHMLTGWLMLTINIPSSQKKVIAFIGFIVLILLAIELSFVFDLKLTALAFEWVAVLFIAWLIRRWLQSVSTNENA